MLRVGTLLAMALWFCGKIVNLKERGWYPIGQGVVSTALLQCSFGTVPVPLNVLPQSKVFCGNMPAGTIMDNRPLVNILPFGMCSNPSNPMVIAATAAALGILTPMPCIPVTVAPWTPGNATVLIGGNPALNDGCQLMCSYGGAISIKMAGQFTVQY